MLAAILGLVCAWAAYGAGLCPSPAFLSRLYPMLGRNSTVHASGVWADPVRELCKAPKMLIAICCEDAAGCVQPGLHSLTC